MRSPSPSSPSSLTFHLIPHTHWDREWYLTRAGFQARLAPVVDEVLEQLEHDGDARFVLDGQTILLQDYLAARPGREARLEALISRGALEVGPWYVLSDLLIPSATSLRRNLAEGRRAAEAFGGRMNVLYSPDAFGHPAALPALAAEFGIRRGVIRRGLGRPEGQDRDLYRWESPTGESILVYHLPASGYDIAIDLAGRGKNLAEQWTPIRQALTARAGCDQIAVFLGADHHGMARGLAGLRDHVQLLEPGHRVRVSSLTEYFEAVERSAPELGSIRGELRRIDGHTWVLQGIHATRSRMKRRHSRAELVLSRITEPLARMAAEQRGADRTGLIALAWRTLLECQFHDTLAGTTSDAVQREQEVRLETVETLCREIAAPSLWQIGRRRAGSDTGALVLWNPVERPRGGIMAAELTFFRKDVLVGPPSGRSARTGAGHLPFVLADAAGALIPVQVLGARRDQERVDSPRRYPDQDEVDRVWIACDAPGIAPLGFVSLVPSAAGKALAPKPRELRVGPGVLANPHVELRLSPVGALTLTDRHTGERYRALGELEDEADRGDTYTFSAGAGPVVQGGMPESTRVVARGPLIGAVEARWSMRSAGKGRILARLLVVLHADSPIVRLRFDIENQAIDHRLRARFPVGAGRDAMAGAAFGVERRPAVTDPVKRDAIEQPVRTAPAQRFVAAGQGARGLAVLAPGFFEYEWTAKRDLVVTLLRSVGELSRNQLPERPGHAAWPMPTPGAQETGSHTIELALVVGPDPSAGPERLEEHWEDSFLPVLSFFRRKDRS